MAKIKKNMADSFMTTVGIDETIDDMEEKKENKIENSVQKISGPKKNTNKKEKSVQPSKKVGRPKGNKIVTIFGDEKRNKVLKVRVTEDFKNNFEICVKQHHKDYASTEELLFTLVYNWYMKNKEN